MPLLLDFNLLHTKYYKKRLEPWLKKKKIYITNYILIEFTELTIL